MGENRLVEIPVEDLPKLRDLYKDRKTEASAYNTIQNYIDWFRRVPSLDFAKFYSLNGDWSDGTFVLKESTNSVTSNTLSDSGDRLLAALHCLDRGTSVWSGIPERIFPTIEKYLNQLGDVSTTPTLTIWYHIPREEALAFNTDPPEGVTLTPLRQEDVNTINDMWPHRYEGSDQFVSRVIALNLTVGAYDKDGVLLGWIFQLPVGSLGILHVKNEHKRKGYGSLLVRALSKKFAQLDMEVTAPVVHTNTPSREMFKKLNFKEIDKVYWWPMSPKK